MNLKEELERLNKEVTYLNKEVTYLNKEVRICLGQLDIFKSSLREAIWLTKFNWGMIKNKKLREETKKKNILYTPDSSAFNMSEDVFIPELNPSTCEELLNKMDKDILAMDAYRQLYIKLTSALKQDEYLSQYKEDK